MHVVHPAMEAAGCHGLEQLLTLEAGLMLSQWPSLLERAPP